MHRGLLVLALFLLSPNASQAEMRGTVARVIDGDTFIVCTKAFMIFRRASCTRIRVCGIDAPEAKDPGGPETTRALTSLIGGRHIRFDEHGRTPAQRGYGDHEHEWKTAHRFQGEYARLFGPRRRGRSFSMSQLDPAEDSDDFHEYHLQLEADHAPPGRRRRARRSRQ